MKEITLKIPEKNLPFFMELIGQLGYEICDNEKATLTQEMKTLIDQRLKEDKSEYQPARETLKSVRNKYGL